MWTRSVNIWVSSGSSVSDISEAGVLALEFQKFGPRQVFLWSSVQGLVLWFRIQILGF